MSTPTAKQMEIARRIICGNLYGYSHSMLSDDEYREDQEEIAAALADAVEAATRAAQQRWIPVSERLPEMYQPVLVATRKFVQVSHLLPKGFWLSDDDNGYERFFKAGRVIAWQPLPPPPAIEGEPQT